MAPTGLPASNEAAGEADGAVVVAQRVGVEQPPGNDQGVVVAGVGLGERAIHLDRAALVEVAHALDRASGGRDHLHLGAGLAQGAQRFQQFGFLEAVAGEDGDALAVESGHGLVPLGGGGPAA